MFNIKDYPEFSCNLDVMEELNYNIYFDVNYLKDNENYDKLANFIYNIIGKNPKCKDLCFVDQVENRFDLNIYFSKIVKDRICLDIFIKDFAPKERFKKKIMDRLNDFVYENGIKNKEINNKEDFIKVLKEIVFSNEELLKEKFYNKETFLHLFNTYLS